MTRRLSALEAITEPLADADGDEIYERLQRLRYGSRDENADRHSAG